MNRNRLSPGSVDSGVAEISGRRSRRGSRSPIPLPDEKSATSTPERMPVGTTKSGILAQQIHDEFLCCKICLEAFTNPKSLDCLHTFCEECIENHANSESSYKKYSDYREFTCPLCRKRTTLPLGGVKKLPDNFLVSSLTEIVERQKPSKIVTCDFCKLVNRKHKEATSKCLDCNKVLCKACVDQHLSTKVTQKHNVFDMEIEKDIECKEHVDEVVRFYCETCEVPVCILCTFNDHKEHDVEQFSEAVKKYKSNIENLTRDCKSNLEKFEKQIEIVSSCEECIKTAETKIRDVSIDMIADIRNRERLLIEEIHNMYGPETMALIERKNELQANLDGLKNTVQLTDLILKGKDMELLLLQKEVQGKLQTMRMTADTELPKTATKVITFMPGMLDMGYIHDSDRPLLSATRRTISGTGSIDIRDTFDAQDYLEEAAAQTECSLIDTPEKATNTPTIDRSDEETQTEGGDDDERLSSVSRTDMDEEERNMRRQRRRRERETESKRSRRHRHEDD